MNTIQMTIRDKVAIVGLNRGTSNAINAEMVKELHTVFDSVEKDDAIAGLILTGKENFFSAGADLVELYSYNEEQIRAFWNDFLKLTARMVSFSKPFIAAVNGHSPAGGCV